MYKLINTCQNYQWGKTGSDSYVYAFSKAQDSLLGQNEPPAASPYAEFWMGCHPKAPSQILLPSGPTPLATFLASNGLPELPYLFKILSIGGCLSLQAHPKKDLAALLHAKDPANYPDANHKPEMAVVLKPGFRAFSNFAPKEQIAANFARYPSVAAALAEPLAKFTSATDEAKSREALKELFTATATLDKSVLDALKSEATGHQPQTVRDQVVLDVLAQHPGDLSAVATLAFNILELDVGQCFAMNPHEPHSYITGEILEVMALSDNVVRLGLTPKYKDTNTILNMLEWKMGEQDLLNPIVSKLNELSIKEYQPAGFEEFQLVTVEGPAFDKTSVVKHKLHIAFHAIIAVIGGGPVEFTVSQQGAEQPTTVTLQQHETGFVVGGSSITIESAQSEIYLAICTKNGPQVVRQD